MPYLLDSNVFIQAKNCHYGFDFCPAFWDWLVHNIATAKAKNYILVSHEKYSPESRKKVPIPNVCKLFNVECIDTFEMLRREKARFVLDM